MDKRSEPRFQVRSAIKIAAIDHPELVCEAILLDVSGAGLKIVSDNWWPLETRIVIELENHLVVARVRNIVARGPKFALGAERIYSVLKHTLPAGVSRTVWHNLLRAEMRDVPVVPESAAPEPVDPLEIAPPEIEAPAVRSSEIAERERAARKITLRASEPPETQEVRPEPPAIEQSAEPSTAAEDPKAAEPSSGSHEESEALNPEALNLEALNPEALNLEALNLEPGSMASPSAATPSEPLPAEPPAVAQPSFETTGAEQAEGEQSPVEQLGKAEQVMEEAPPATMAEPAQIASEVEPKVAGVIPEARPEGDAPPASYKKPAPVEALASETRPQALPKLREAVVAVASEVLSSQPPASIEPDAQTVPPQAVLPVRTATAPNSLEPANPVEDAAGRILRGTMQDRRRRVGADSKAPAEPPMARAFPLVPNAACPDVSVATLPLTPQFGPAYGMAPTADVLLPVSTMPEVVTVPEAKPSWVISSAVVAAVIGLVALAFYYGPFRPKAASAPGTQTAQHVETPLTIPAVTEAPSAATSEATNAAANAPANTPTSAQAIPAPSVTQATIPAAPAAIPAPSGQAQTGTNPTGIKPVPAQMAKVNSSSLRAEAAVPTQAGVPARAAMQTAAPVQASQPKAAPVASLAPTVSTSTGSTTTRRVTVKAASLLWFSDCSDGKPAIQKVLQTGDSMDIEFHQMTVFKLGNAAAAQMTLDGKPLGVLGTPGAVKIVELTAAGLRELPPTTPAGTECQPMRASAKP